VPGVEVLAGSAEELPLPDGRATRSSAASAFHWFDTERALAEIHRVLRPAGASHVSATAATSTDPLQPAFQEIVGRYLPTWTRSSSWIADRGASPLFGPPETFDMEFEQLSMPRGSRSGWDGLVRRRLADGERAEVLARIRELGEAQPESPFPFRYQTHAPRVPAFVRTSSGGRAHRHTEFAVKSPKILAVASAVDLDFRYGCTPAWWQLWKGLHEAGAT
jgi:SAM-dependent methyltransferase